VCLYAPCTVCVTVCAGTGSPLVHHFEYFCGFAQAVQPQIRRLVSFYIVSSVM
jgi:hypothetical protein